MSQRGGWRGGRRGSRRLLRALAGMVATGLVVELALIPLTLFHFHKAGLYGVAANLVAIPWTTFVVMPLEFLALLAEPLGGAGPLWSAVGWAIGRLLVLAHAVSGLDGAVATMSSMPGLALGLMVAGGLWIALWSGRVRRWGAVPVALGALLALMAPTPDLLVSGDGRHVALIGADGRPMLLRVRTGDFTRDLVREVSAFDGEPGEWAALPGARCSRDACLADIPRDGRSWRILAIRSRDLLRWRDMIAACTGADIVVADRRLPPQCRPRWLKLDREALARSGGLAIVLGSHPTVDSVAGRLGEHPWRGLAPPRPNP